MKVKNLFLSVILFLFSCNLYAQSYSVWFNNPTHNSTVSGSVIDNTRSSIDISFGWSGQKANSQNKWKFKVIKDILVGGGNTYAETWVYEDTPYCTLPGDVLYQNWYVIYMYEEDYITKILTQRASTSYITVTVQQTVYVENNFGTGTVSVNGSPYGSGSVFNLSYGQGLSLAAIENQVDAQGYTRVWNTSGSNQSTWKVESSIQSYSSSYTYNATLNQNGIHIRAELRKVCNISFNGPVTANGNYYYSQPVSVTALGYTRSDYIDMGFSSWGDGNSQNPRSFTVYNNASYSINYAGIKPNNGYKNLQFVGSTGQNIQLQWSEHPNSAVNQYQIWRRVKHNGVTGPDTQIGTVGRGVCSFTDYQYVYTSSYSDDLLWYDVRAYYSTAGTYADAEYNAAFGRIDYRKEENSNLVSEISNELPGNYDLSNYPNPFNPTTTISYQLPENSFVTIKIFDILGKEVTTLINENKPAGYYTVIFDAGHSERGRGMTSGVYIYTISANGFVQSKKMLLAK
jgi:hypothetical protein